jgi:hypothetical protein
MGPWGSRERKRRCLPAAIEVSDGRVDAKIVSIYKPPYKWTDKPRTVFFLSSRLEGIEKLYLRSTGTANDAL